jgi:membrane-associated phospholipid phosphatase
VFQQNCQLIDQKCFLLLNTTLLQSEFGQWFWGILSHKNESWINVIVMLAINLWSIILIKRSNNKSTALVLYCWLSFQVVLLINILVFGKWLQINRNSPSMIISHPFKLSMLLNNPDIKDFSNNSFPAGHTLVCIYWGLFINLYAPKLIKILGWVVISVLILPRMITGAHWLSDVVFSVGLGWMYFNLSMWFANKYETIKQRIY